MQVKELVGQLLKILESMDRIDYIILALKVGIAIFMVYAFYLVFAFLEKNQLIKKSLQRFYEQTEKSRSERYDKELQIRYEDGEQEKQNLLTKLDILIVTSEIRRLIPFLNTEVYLVLSILIGAIAFFAINFLHGSWILGIVGFISALLVAFMIVTVMSGLNYKKTEDELMTFVNLLENYSSTSDSIVKIFGKITPFINEPIKTAIEECYVESTRTGDVSAALANLQLKVEHTKFKEIIRNIEICSRHEANYGEVIQGNKELLRDYLASQKERKAIISNGRIEVGIVLTCCLFMLGMVDNFMERGILDVLFNSFVGNLLLLYCVVIVIACIIKLIGFEKR